MWIVVSALAYVTAAWVVLRNVGEVAGKTGQLYVAGGLIVALIGNASWNVLKAQRRAPT